MPKKRSKLLTIKLEGPNLKEGKISIDTFTSLISKIQSCVEHYGLVLYGKTGKTIRRYPDIIKRECSLEIVSLSPGSLEIVFELSKKEEPMLIEMPQLGEKSVNLMIDTISGFGSEKPLLPPEVNVSIIRLLRDIAIITEKQIDSIRFDLQKPFPKHAIITKQTKDRIEKYLLEPYWSATVLEGILRELDLERNKCQVFPLDRKPFIRCTFKEEYEEEIIMMLDKNVKIHGEAKIHSEDGSIQELEIQNIEIIVHQEENMLFREEQVFKCKNLLDSDLVGIWKDRADMPDTINYVDELRKKISRRGA